MGCATFPCSKMTIARVCVQWANTGVFVQGRFYALARLYFASRNPEEPETMESPQPAPMANGSALNEVLEAAAAANAIVM